MVTLDYSAMRSRHSLSLFSLGPLGPSDPVAPYCIHNWDPARTNLSAHERQCHRGSRPSPPRPSPSLARHSAKPLRTISRSVSVEGWACALLVNRPDRRWSAAGRAHWARCRQAHWTGRPRKPRERLRRRQGTPAHRRTIHTAHAGARHSAAAAVVEGGHRASEPRAWRRRRGAFPSIHRRRRRDCRHWR